MNTQRGWTDKYVPSHQLTVSIGRYSPFHLGHFKSVDAAQRYGENTLVLVGSSFKARDIRNPFTFKEREAMIRAAFSGIKPFMIQPVRDVYNDNSWVAAVQAEINDACKIIGMRDGKEIKDVKIVGHDKDSTSYYLKKFPQYGSIIDTGMMANISATDIRELLFNREIYTACDKLPPGTKEWMLQWLVKNEAIYENLVAEYDHNRAYRSQFDHLKYDPIFVTVDAVVLCHGHILLVQRKCAPGKGLWALPGGFLENGANKAEVVKDGILRELKEETSIDVSVEQLRLALHNNIRFYDSPMRSLRGRTITFAGTIPLDFLSTLPKVKGQASEVSSVRWFTLADFYGMEELMFEDHYGIGCDAAGHTR